jgi:hypothetical protein
MKRLFKTLLFLILCAGKVNALPLLSVSAPLNNTKFVADLTNKKIARIAQMRDFVKLSVADYEQMKGRKLTRVEKRFFKYNQKMVKQRLQIYDGDITGLMKLSWFLRGMVLGPIAILLAYLLLDEDERSVLLKWTWFGFGALVILVGVLYFIYL